MMLRNNIHIWIMISDLFINMKNGLVMKKKIVNIYQKKNNI